MNIIVPQIFGNDIHSRKTNLDRAQIQPARSGGPRRAGAAFTVSAARRHCRRTHKQKGLHFCSPFLLVWRPAGFEPDPLVRSQYSIQLSYGRINTSTVVAAAKRHQPRLNRTLPKKRSLKNWRARQDSNPTPWFVAKYSIQLRLRAHTHKHLDQTPKAQPPQNGLSHQNTGHLQSDPGKLARRQDSNPTPVSLPISIQLSYGRVEEPRLYMRSKIGNPLVHFDVFRCFSPILRVQKKKGSNRFAAVPKLATIKSRDFKTFRGESFDGHPNRQSPAQNRHRRREAPEASELATRLGDTLGRRGKADVTLIDRNRTHIWKPKLHEIAAGSMDIGDHEVGYLARPLAPLPAPHRRDDRPRPGEAPGHVAPSSTPTARVTPPAPSLRHPDHLGGQPGNDFGTRACARTR